MLGKGIETDPATGRPRVEREEEKKQINDRREEEILRARAAYAGMLATEPGKLLVGMVRQRLMDRIRTLAAADPEAKTLSGLLNDLGIADALADDAVLKLFDRTMKKE